MKRGKVLINGAGGFLGSHTVETFIEAGYDVRATDLPGANLAWAEELGAEVMHADLSKLSEAIKVTAGMTGVVNVAGVFDFSKTYDQLYNGNVRVTENMCRAALEAKGEKFVHIATIGVYGEPAYTPMDEDGPKRPKNPYELTKKLGEDKVWEYQRMHGLPAAILRPGPIYGPRSRYIHSNIFVTNILMGMARKPTGVAIDDAPYCHHVHVEDVARASMLLLQLPRTIGNAYNCCDQTPIKWSRLLELVVELTGFEPGRRLPWFQPLVNLTVHLVRNLVPQGRLDQMNARMAKAWTRISNTYGLVGGLQPRVEKDMLLYLLGDHVYDTSKLKSLGFEWKYPEIAAGLRQTHEWLVSNKWIPPNLSADQKAA